MLVKFFLFASHFSARRSIDPCSLSVLLVNLDCIWYENRGSPDPAVVAPGALTVEEVSNEEEEFEEYSCF